MCKMNLRFLRYPGGKGKLIAFLQSIMPQGEGITGRYVEPFLGGGAAFLHIRPDTAILSDIDSELTDIYRGIRQYPHKVWEIYRSFPEGKEAYYQIRNTEYSAEPIYWRAARNLYLNRTCFKGMWRYGPDGRFNVGYGGEERRWVIRHKDLVELSRRLKGATILNSDFEPILAECRDGDFIFLDPPYKPGEKELVEAHYAYASFTFEDQIRLSIRLREISTTHDLRWAMTNSAHEQICELYAGFVIERMRRGVSGIVGVHTDDTREVLIRNFS